MKYEDEYSGMCWDYLFFDCNREESLIELLRDYYGVEIMDIEEVRMSFLAMMERFHEVGIIKPKQDKE